MDLGIKGKRALVTGGAGGMGMETIKRFIEAGVIVTATDLKDEDLERVRLDFGIECIAGDLSSKQGMDDLIARAGKDFDTWVHAAGVTGAKGDPLTMDEKAWEDALNIDFLSGVRMARHLCPAMIDRGWDRVVFVTSENVAQPYPDETVYISAESALLSQAKSIAMAHSGKGLLVNCVAPAFIATPMTDGMMEMRSAQANVSFAEAERPVFVPDYPLAPERPWSAQRDAAAAILDALVECDVVGDSAGGHLALVLATRRAVRIGRLAVLSSNTDRSGQSTTRSRNSVTDLMNDDAQDRRLSDMAFGDLSDHDPEASPLLADLGALPPLS